MKRVTTLLLLAMPLFAWHIPKKCVKYQKVSIEEISQNDAKGIYCKELIYNLKSARKAKKINKLLYIGKALLALDNLKPYVKDMEEFDSLKKEYKTYIKSILNDYPNQTIRLSDGSNIYKIFFNENRDLLEIKREKSNREFKDYDSSFVLSKNEGRKEINKSYYAVTTTRLRIRAKPKKESKVLDIIPSKEKVKILAIPTPYCDYYYIQWKKKGWVFKKYLKIGGKR